MANRANNKRAERGYDHSETRGTGRKRRYIKRRSNKAYRQTERDDINAGLEVLVLAEDEQKWNEIAAEMDAADNWLVDVGIPGLKLVLGVE